MVSLHYVEQLFMIGLNASRREGSNLKGKSSTLKNQEIITLVQNLVEEDGRITINEIANAVGISHRSAFSILTEDLHLSKFSACWVPKALQENQLN